MQSIIDFFTGIFGFLTGNLWGFLVSFVEWVKQLVTVVIPDIVYSILPAGVAEYLRTFDLDTLSNYIEPVTWFIPFWSILTIYLTAYALCGGVRLVRFIIGFIPTIEG